MNANSMSLTGPLSRGWERMVQMLFKPFDAGKWLVVAFSAWLARLADGGGGGGGGDLSFEEGGAQVVEGVHRGWDWIRGHELMAGVIAGAALLILALVLLVLWVSSRGKFVFLDNVVHDRGEIAAPWKRFGKHGNSLFLFRLIAGLLCLPVAIALIALFAWLAVGPDGWSTPTARRPSPASSARCCSASSSS